LFAIIKVAKIGAYLLKLRRIKEANPNQKAWLPSVSRSNGIPVEEFE